MKSQNGSEYFEQWDEFSIEGPSHRYAAVFGESSGNATNKYLGDAWDFEFYTRDRTDHADVHDLDISFSCKGECFLSYDSITRGWWGDYWSSGLGYNPNGVWGQQELGGLTWFLGYDDTHDRHVYIYPTFVEIKVRHC